MYHVRVYAKVSICHIICAWYEMTMQHAPTDDSYTMCIHSLDHSWVTVGRFEMPRYAVHMISISCDDDFFHIFQILFIHFMHVPWVFVSFKF